MTTHLAHRWRLAAAVTTTTVLLAACSSDGPSFDAAPAPSVDLAVDLPERLLIGVVRSSSTGSDLVGPASGARVAEFRLNGLQGTGHRIRLKVVNDNGTAEGAVEAIEDLAESGVAGVVYASAGDYLGPALTRASELGVPVLAPFEIDDDLAEGRDTVWLTGPSAAAQLRAISALSDRRDIDLLKIRADADYAPEALTSYASDPITIDGSAEPATLDAQLAGVLTPASPPGGILVWGPPAAAANTVAAIQRFPYATLVPVYTSSDGTRPAFADALAALQLADNAVSDGPLLSVLSATDLDPNADTQAFFAALHLAAADEDVRSLDGLGSLGIGAAEADIRAHDAVLLLANAARKAESRKPADVLKALEELEAEDVPGLVGPMPDFSRSSAIASDDLVVVQADPLGSDVRSDLPQVEVAGAAPAGARFGWLPVDAEDART